MAQPEFVQAVIDEVEAIVGTIKDDLGYLGSALCASIKYDCQKAFDEAVAAGKYAASTFIAVSKAALSNYWLTVKEQLSQAWASLYATFQASGFQAAVDQATNLLKNINWRSVEVALTGIATATLATTARSTVQMLIAGVLAAA